MGLKAVLNKPIKISSSLFLKSISFLFLPIIGFIIFSFVSYPLKPHCSLGNGLLGCTPICEATSYFENGQPASYKVTPCFHEGPSDFQKLLFRRGLLFFPLIFVLISLWIYKDGFKKVIKKLSYVAFAPLYLFIENKKNKNLISKIAVILIIFFLAIEWIFGYYVVLKTFINNNQTSTSSTNTSCDEQKTLEKAKFCTVLVLRDDGGHGSGFSIEKGYIITNRHVIEGAKKLTTWINKEEPLTLWNYSENEDLAVLKIQTEIPTCDLFNSKKIKLAETLYAVGWPNVPEGESSITKGIYSRTIKAKEGPEFIQTDAAINPGSSGGPLLNQCGVVGINTSKLTWSDYETPSEGFGFALASNYFKTIVEDLIKKGSVKKLPIPSSKPKKYTPSYNYEENNQSDYSYDKSTLVSWINARERTREMLNYWNNKDSGGYDKQKFDELKDILARMSAVVETIVPKMMEGKQLSSEENRLLNEWNSMYNKALTLEGQLDNQNYYYGYYHYECRSGACIKVSGRGKNTCSSFYDCQPKYRYTCKDMMCVKVEGDGPNDCYFNSDCYHYACQGKSCVKVAGKGTDECYYEGDSYSCVHNECRDGKCVEVEGKGINSCYSDYGCQ